MRETRVDRCLSMAVLGILCWMARDAWAAGGTCPENSAVSTASPHTVSCPGSNCMSGDGHCVGARHPSYTTVTIWEYVPGPPPTLRKTTNVLQTGADITDCQCVDKDDPNTIYIEGGNCCHTCVVHVTSTTTAIGTTGYCGSGCPAGSQCTATLNANGDAVGECQ